MKKSLLLSLLFLTFSFVALGQNYQCLQTGVKHYFINGHNYLRGIRIDSTKLFGDTTTYYPFHTPRGPWMLSLGGYFATLDNNGGSWLGKQVLQTSDGTFYFDNIRGDTIIVKTQAGIGDAWVFCRDTSSVYYMANVIAKDTATLLGVLDSIKTIIITSHDASGAPISDIVDSFKITLSKNCGFSEVFDLYTFPYHDPHSSWNDEQDFYSALSTSEYYYSYYYYIPTPPSPHNSIFKLVEFTNPTLLQLNETPINTVYEKAHFYGSVPNPFTYHLDTVINKITTDHYETYFLHGVIGDYDFETASYNLSGSGGEFTYVDSIYLFDTTKMPEETNSNFCNYYIPYDSSFCTVSPAYISGLIFGDDGESNTYKIGFGQTDFLWLTGDPSYWEDKTQYADKGAPCGSFYPLSVSTLTPINFEIQLFPNPATNQLTIKSSGKLKEISITNILGQQVFSSSFNSEQVIIDVSSLQPGIYFLKINGFGGKKFVKE